MLFLIFIGIFDKINHMQEIIKNINNEISVSNLGYAMKNGKKIKMYDNGRGYLFFHLNKKNLYIHRLVAQLFVPNPNNYNEVNHKDEDKTNNCADNLEWCNREYNINYGTRLFRMSKQVEQYDLEGNFINSFESCNEAGRKTNITSANIGKCARGLRTHAGGYIWKYAS